MKKVAIYVVSLKVFLKNDRGEVLIVKTPTSSSFHWMYDFPGGRIDEDEFETKYQDILKREIVEELGNVEVELWEKPVAIARHKAVYPKRTEYIYYTFWEWVWQSWTLKLSDEHDDFLWIKLEEVELEKYFCSGMLEAAKMYLNK